MKGNTNNIRKASAMLLVLPCFSFAGNWTEFVGKHQQRLATLKRLILIFKPWQVNQNFVYSTWRWSWLDWWLEWVFLERRLMQPMRQSLLLFFFIAWVAGGLVALCGALTYAEIGSRFPATGGYYKVFAECYHPSIAFAINCIILISNAASMSGVALIGSEYISQVIFKTTPDNTTRHWRAECRCRYSGTHCRIFFSSSTSIPTKLRRAYRYDHRYTW